MEVPAIGVTTRARSKNRSQTETQAPRESTEISDGGRSPALEEAYDIEGHIEQERARADLLEHQVMEHRRRQEAAVESRIAELEAQSNRRRQLERELQELLQEKDDRTMRERRLSGSDSRGLRSSSLESNPNDGHQVSLPYLRNGRKAPRFRDLPTFNGKSIKEAQAFVAGAERRFRIDANTQYPTDQDKIDYCALAFGTGPAAKWERHERREGLGRTTWAQFKEWMLDSIIDPSNRAFDAITSYNAARQRDGQTAEEFAAYLDTLELELQINDEKLRKMNLFATLRGEVQRDILQRDDVPETRQGMLSLATRIENTHRLADKRTQPRRVNDDPGPTRANTRRALGEDTRRQRYEAKRSDNDPATHPNQIPVGQGTGRQDDGCYGCHSKGHRLAQCPEATCYHCNKKGHISPNCPELTGKGDSRQ